MGSLEMPVGSREISGLTDQTMGKIQVQGWVGASHSSSYLMTHGVR